MPSQNAAISSADSASNTRIRFFRTAKMTMAMAQSKKPSSGQNNPERPPPHPSAASCIKNEADEVAAVRRAPSAPARATPLAQSGSTQFFRASRQSSQVCATTTPTIIKTNSATFPLLSANRFGYRTYRAASPCSGERESSYDRRTVEGRCRRIPSVHCRYPLRQCCFDRPCCSCLQNTLLRYHFFRRAQKTRHVSRVHYTKSRQLRKRGVCQINAGNRLTKGSCG